MFLFTPGVGVEHFFLVDPNWNVSLAPTPSVGVVQIFGGMYGILVFKSMINFLTWVNKA